MSYVRYFRPNHLTTEFLVYHGRHACAVHRHWSINARKEQKQPCVCCSRLGQLLESNGSWILEENTILRIRTTQTGLLGIYYIWEEF